MGTTLLVGDAQDIETTPDGKAVLTAPNGLKEFDVIVGNPPWSFKGRAGTAARRRNGNTSVPRQSRGESLDFIMRAAEFAHGDTRFGMILSATPFFSNSKSSASASCYVIRQLAPVTLVNLSNLTQWLFKASMPAVALFARHRPQRSDQLTVVHVPWSPIGAKTHTFEISPSDVTKLSFANWEKNPILLKTSTFGSPRDRLLVETLTSSFDSLETCLNAQGAELRDGLIEGRPEYRTRDARALRGMEILRTNDLYPFSVPRQLPPFRLSKAQWPRTRDIYRSPILLIKEFFRKSPRAVAAVANRDLIYTDAFFGAALPLAHRDIYVDVVE